MRRILLFASLLLLISAFSSALRPRDDGSSGNAPSRIVPAPTDRVRATLPSDEPVEVTVGDIVELTVRSELTERAEVRDLGIDAPVDPGLPATLLVIADRAGSFPVTLRYSGERIGTLEVLAR